MDNPTVQNNTAAQQGPIQPQGEKVLPEPTIPSQAPKPQKQKKLKKKRVFSISTAVKFIFISLLIITIAGGMTYMFAGDELMRLLSNAGLIALKEPQPPEEPPKPIVTDPEDPDDDGWKEFIHRNHEFAMSYPVDSLFLEPEAYGSGLDTYTVIYSGENQNKQVIAEVDVEDGYMVQISVFKDLLNQNVEETALQKRAAYLARCATAATYSDIVDIELAGVKGKGFEVRNCDQDYIENFLIWKNTLYEFTQVYKGDIGYQQLYKNTTRELLDKFEFINIIQPSPQETWETKNFENLFTFKYPLELDANCCTLTGPLSPTAQKIIVLADPESVTEGGGTRFSGFGVFVDTIPTDTEYNQYLEMQKNLLKENYEVIIGKIPETAEEGVLVGGVPGILLKNYAWWGDIIYVQVPNKPRVLVIVKTELTPGEMSEIINTVLPTFDFQAVQP